MDRWRNCQYYAQQFWQRWSSEYLSRLQRLQEKENLQIGDLVLIKDERFPSNQWPLGRILETHAGCDGLIRVVTLKSNGGVLKRPIVKLCPLPTQDNWHDSSTDTTC
ncbi:hypothetical protein ACLKA6_005827 [Drosophila palustris]